MVSSAGLENGAERGVARGSPVPPVFALKSPTMGCSWCLRLLCVLKVSHGFKCKSIPLSSLMLKEEQIVSCTGVGSVWPAASSANKVVLQHTSCLLIYDWLYHQLCAPTPELQCCRRRRGPTKQRRLPRGSSQKKVAEP